ncbi:hypothetical protein [Sphingomonas sp.]|uniref:hypothetical protein n=1 Tax=Sphingomonas sp. TaxID=28214 RepID=UPI0031D0EFF8
MRRGWAFLLGGLIVWAVHFFVLYAIASIYLTTATARLLTLGITVLCLGAVALLAGDVLRFRSTDRVDAWMRNVALCGLVIAAVATLWQALPALLI